MTPQERQHLVDLIHAAFELAREQGAGPPIDLTLLGVLLRRVQPGFSHRVYGHEKLVNLLREFTDDLIIEKIEIKNDTPRFTVMLASAPVAVAPLTAPLLLSVIKEHSTLKALDSRLVDGSLLERFLDRLANSTAAIHQRLKDVESRSGRIKKELKQSRTNEELLRSEVLKNSKHTEDLERRLSLLNLDPLSVIKNSEDNKKTDPLSICGDFSVHHYLKWDVGMGRHVKAGQVVAEVHHDKNLNLCIFTIKVESDGVLSKKMYFTGANLYGSKVLIGKIKPRKS